MKGWLEPFDEFKRMQDKFAEMLEKEGELFHSFTQFLVDVIEEDDRVRIVAELPGFKKEDINISLTDSHMDISARREEKKEEKEKEYFKRERRYGEMRRRMSIPVEINEEAISATYENGVLEVILPKKQPTNKRVINIA